MRTKNLPYRPRAEGTHSIGSWSLFLLAGALALSGRLGAAPGEISQSPLFLTTGVQPNVFVLLDDSGSMDSEVLKSEGARVAHPEGTFPDQSWLNFEPNTEAQKLELCLGYNVLAYDPDPTVKYSPWKGVDKDGNAFADQVITAAQVNPYTGATSTACQKFLDNTIRNTNGDTCNLLTGFSGSTFYYPWNDDGDGVYEAGECPTDGTSAADPGSRI